MYDLNIDQCINTSYTWILQDGHGRCPQSEIWVFELCDTSHSPATGFVQIVPDRRAATLLPRLMYFQVQLSTLDMWSSYRRVQSLPIVVSHETGNHYIEFVNSITGVHTQNIESYWNRIKRKLKKDEGCQCWSVAKLPWWIYVPEGEK